MLSVPSNFVSNSIPSAGSISKYPSIRFINVIPFDRSKKAIAKAKGAGQEDYKEVVYEGFGPGASTLIIKTLTDNVNRTVGEVRAAFNKVHKSLGAFLTSNALPMRDHFLFFSLLII